MGPSVKILRAMFPLCGLVMLIVLGTSGQTVNSDSSSPNIGSSCPNVNPVINNYAQTCGSHAVPAATPPRDCEEVKNIGYQESGRYRVTPDDGDGSFFVFCDMETDGGGWTVFQRRENGIVDFYRPWTEYRNGFGLVVGEHWLGNEKIHRLTSQKRYKLRVELHDWDGNTAYAEYELFHLLGEESQYKLVIGSYRGTAGDSLGYHKGMQFSTHDADHDDNDRNCANVVHGAWWYGSCYTSHLNGRYYEDDVTDQQQGVTWRGWKSSAEFYSMKATEMKILPA